MLIAVPSNAPGGLDASISDHFGHCDLFTLIEVEDGTLGDARTIANAEHEHGGCMAPVMLLRDQGVGAIIAGGMGARPLAGFQSVGISVFKNEGAATVRDVAQGFAEGRWQEFGSNHTCGGGEGHCGEHHHEPVQREPADGPVARGHVVTMDFKLFDDKGNLLDTSDNHGPLAYLHGRGQIVPGLEKIIEGHVAGDTFTAEVSPEEGYGDYDDKRIIEVPRDQVPPDVAMGTFLHGRDSAGNVMALKVVGLTDEIARLDANHPLAGMNLKFEITVNKVEQATAEELAHGHVH